MDDMEAGQLEQLERVAIDIVRSAGALLINRPATLSYETKTSAVDVVTEMDKASEELVTQYLLAHRPGDGLVGEEGSDLPSSTGITWIVDPIDGTVNYLYGLPGWNISIAAQRTSDCAILAGAVFAPLLFGGALWSAHQGGGAWLRIGNQEPTRLRVNSNVPLHLALLATGFSYSTQTRTKQGARFAQLIPQVRDIRRMGAAAVDLCLVASGMVDGYFEEELSPWDLAAGELIATEAGALVTNATGGKAGRDMVVAAEPTLHRQIIGALARVAGQ
jgi:myo-inositol-1(or 4)-monophosphatase